MNEADQLARRLRYGGGDDPEIGADVGAAYRREGERAERLDRARRQGERAGRLFGKLIVWTVGLALLGAALILWVAAAHQVWRLAEWAWSWT